MNKFTQWLENQEENTLPTIVLVNANTVYLDGTDAAHPKCLICFDSMESAKEYLNIVAQHRTPGGASQMPFGGIDWQPKKLMFGEWLDLVRQLSQHIRHVAFIKFMKPNIRIQHVTIKMVLDSPRKVVKRGLSHIF